MEFLLFVGTSHSLSAIEVETLFPKARKIEKGLYVIDFPSNNIATQKIEELGGAIKLLKKTSPYTKNTLLIKIKESKNFSISQIPSDPDKTKEISEDLKKSSKLKPRFILAKEPFGLSPLIITKENVKELIIYDNNIYETVWVQNYHRWIKKDRHLPYANARAGILPPKIARILVNISGISPNQDKTLLDPFCGSGRVLIEALELGYNVIGSDISKEQLRQTETNLKFLNFEQNHFKLYLSDATQIKKILKPNSIDLIVTEPFLGRPNPRSDRVPDLVKGLKKLYLGALKSWLPILKPNSRVVMVFPQIKDKKKTHLTSQIIDDQHLMGYNVKTRNLIYSRPEAIIRREIVILEKS